MQILFAWLALGLVGLSVSAHAQERGWLPQQDITNCHYIDDEGRGSQKECFVAVEGATIYEQDKRGGFRMTAPALAKDVPLIVPPLESSSSFPE